MITFKTAKFLKGIDTLAKAVGLTLGPKGQNVAIDKGYETIVLHDGVSVAKMVSSKNKYEDLGIKIVREASLKQVKEVGDGTTVTIVLANAIIQSAQKLINSGVSPMGLRKEIELGSKKLVEAISKLSKPVKTKEEAIRVATVSAEDEELGKLIGEIVFTSGLDGVITVEDSKGSETIVEHQDGMRFDKGYLSPYFMTDPDTGEATVEDAQVLVTDHSISDIHSLGKLLGELANVSKNLVVICPDMSGNALPSFVKTKMVGMANLLCVGAPLFGDKQKNMLQDIALLTGANFISKDAGMLLASVGVADLGRANKVTSTANTTTIIGGAGDAKAVKDRIESIKKQIKITDSDFEKSKLVERLAKLTSGVVVIRVGGNTEVEMKERRERVLDAVAATKAALEDGIVAGGETIFNAIESSLGSTTGEKILKEAIQRPFDLLMEHAGLNPGRMRLLLEEDANPSMGIDVLDGQEKNMLEAGIIDPAKVSKEAIKNAVSVAVSVITTGACIINIDDKKVVSSM